MRAAWRAVVIGACLALLASAVEGQTLPTSDVGEIGMGMMPDPTSMTLPSGLVRTEQAGTAMNPAISGPVDPESYRVGPGDVLQLQLWGRVSRSWTLQVGPEGTVIVPGSGTVRVADKTLAETRREIISQVQDRFRGVSMDLRLSRPRQFVIYITGQVKSPGPITAIGSHRVGDVVNPGTVADNAAMRRVEVRHTDGTREIADLGLFLSTGVNSLNPWLRDGDILYVPVATDFIYAQGAVARPGRFELGPRDSLLTLFNLAGDPTPAADITRALLLRWRDPFTPESLWVRLDDAYSRKVNPELREGDRIYVYYLPQYHLQHEAFVQGEVARPGAFPIAEGKHHLSDLIHVAGGFLPTADLSAIRVHRLSPGAGARDPELDRLLRLPRDQMTVSEYGVLRTKLAALREDYSVDWNRLQKSPDDLDLLVRDGDIVRVERLVNSIRVDGEVVRPGILTYRPGLTVGDYIRQAGGFTDRAWANRVRVTRAVTGQTLPSRNVAALDPGDFVWVPERPDRTFWDFAQDTLTALAQLATVIIAVRSI